jgi:hypothetical protein
MESLRILLADAANRDLEVHQMDAVSAYLLGELEEEVYLAPPEGLEIELGKALRLKKGIPGLKQSGRVWNKTVVAFLEECGLTSIPADQSVFANADRTVVVALYVDDFILIAPTGGHIRSIKQGLASRFEMKDLGEAQYILGIRISRDRRNRSISIDQAHYVRELLDEEQISTRAATPASGYDGLTPKGPQEPAANVEAYQRLLGKLNWLVRGTRLDIAFTVQKLSQFAHNPSMRHIEAAHHVLRYLNQTARLGITFAGVAMELVTGYADSDFAADQSRKSTMGYVFTLGEGPVTWSSKLQRSVSTSTTEAEYHALAYAAKEAVWIRRFLEQIGCRNYVGEPTIVNSDNEGAIALVKNPEFHARTKHIDVSTHYVRELVEDELVKVQYVPTSEMLADCLTKPLKRVQHQQNVRRLGLEEC